jgi:hypothetical protein
VKPYTWANDYSIPKLMVSKSVGNGRRQLVKSVRQEPTVVLVSRRLMN